MNISLLRFAAFAFLVLSLTLIAHPVRAVEALLLEDTYVDNGATGDPPPPMGSNYGAASDLRVFKGNGRVGRTFLKFSLATLPPRITSAQILQARLRLWVNARTTAVGSITLRPVTSDWDEYKLTGNSAGNLNFGLPSLSDLPINSINNFVSIDITDWVKAWLVGKLANNGIEVEPGADTDFLDLSFDSKESNETSHEARLEVSLSGM
jgi:hypothetical protein